MTDNCINQYLENTNSNKFLSKIKEDFVKCGKEKFKEDSILSKGKVLQDIFDRVNFYKNFDADELSDFIYSQGYRYWSLYLLKTLDFEYLKKGYEHEKNIFL